MRNIIGDMSLDGVLAGRDAINSKLLEIVDNVTDAYGIKLLSVEIKNIVPPKEIQEAMEKQMKACLLYTSYDRNRYEGFTFRDM